MNPLWISGFNLLAILMDDEIFKLERSRWTNSALLREKYTYKRDGER